MEQIEKGNIYPDGQDETFNYERYYFFTSTYILEYKVGFTQGKRALEDITRYSNSENVHLMFKEGILWPPRYDLDVESLQKDQIQHKWVEKQYLFQDRMETGSTEQKGYELIVNGKTLPDNPRRKVYYFSKFPYNPGYYSFFWNTYLGIVVGKAN